MKTEEIYMRLFDFSRPTYFKKKREKVPVMEMIKKYFTDEELTEFLETGEILSMEKRYLERHFSKEVYNKMRELEERIAVLEEHRKNKK